MSLVRMALPNQLIQCSYFVILFVMFIITTDRVLSELSCTQINKLGSGAALQTEQIKELSEFNSDELKKCFVLLGKEPLLPEKGAAIWTSILNIYGGAENIPEELLQQLGWVSVGIPSEQFMNLSYTDVDTVAAFGKAYFLSEQQMIGLKEAVMEQWYGKNEEDLTSYDLATLKQILCAFNATSLQMINPISYKGAASELSTLFNCSKEVMRELANLATSYDAFGDPSGWTSIQVANIGCVISGLESVSSIPASSMDGLTPDIMKCLPITVIKAMTEEQIRNLAPAAASAMSKEQVAALNSNKKYELHQAITGLNTKETGNNLSSNNHYESILVTALLALIVNI